MKHLPHLATRIFDTPLLLAPQKFEVIVGVLASRLGIDAPAPVAAVPAGRPARKPYGVTPDGIAVIPVEGTLVRKAYGLNALSGLRSYEDLQWEIEDAATDPAIRGILLDVDSPGGEVAGVFDLADIIHAARSTKPIFAVANNDAFSAAYLLASSAERLYATRTSGLGSVGVIAGHLDMSQADQQAGLKYTIVHAGARKADFSSHAPLSAEARSVLEQEVNRTYDLLVAAVARNRRTPEAAIRGTEAGLFFGEDAVKTGLADRMGTRQDALNDLRQLIINQQTVTQPGGETRMKKEEIVAEHAQGNENALSTRAAGATETAQAATGEPPPEASAEKADIDAIAEARKAGFEQAREIVELCRLAGLPAEAADLLAHYATPAEARQHLLERRATVAGPEIHSHVLPDAGAASSQKADLNNNPVVKAVERLAAGK
jgi:signal peptide peptidase SppA